MSRPNVRVFLALPGGIASSASGSSADVDRLAGLSLEEILNTPVASLTRTSKPLFDHPMSVSLVTREQITSRGYRDLLDVLQTTACWAAHGTSVRATGRWFDRVTTNQQNTLYRGRTLRGVWTADLNARRALTIGRNQFSLGLEVRDLFDRSYEKVSRFDEFFFALPANLQPRRTTGLMLQASF